MFFLILLFGDTNVVLSFYRVYVGCKEPLCLALFLKIRNMEEELKLFRTYVPPNIDHLTETCNTEIKNISRELILKHRQVILLNLYQEDRYPPYFPTEKTEFYNYIDQTPNE